MKTLVIGDAHADPNHSLVRFTALGNYINVHRPDNIVQIGDWGSYDSISFHDRGNARVQEGRRLVDDLESAQEAYNLMASHALQSQLSARRNKKKQYSPNGYWFESNHEYRIKRYIDENPVLEGLVPERDLVGAEADGWTLIGWKHCAYIDGVCFTHIPVNIGNNQPISGKYVAQRATDLHQATVVFGHTHRFGVASNARNSETGSHYLEAINVGWFGDYVPEYIDGHMETTHWWSGLVMLEHIGYGKVDISRISMESLKRDYL